MSEAGRIIGRDPATGQGIAVTVADGLVSAIESTAFGADAPFLSPGFVDLQVNGYGGHDLNDGPPSRETLESLARLLLAAGTTSFAPTLITASQAQLCAGLAAIAAARKASPMLAAMIPFIHVEGPSLDPADGPRGAHPLEHVRTPSLTEFALWQQAAEGLVGMVTLSPHYPEAPAYIAALSAQGVLVSIGHTGATPEQIAAAAAAGARLSTHLGNGAASLLPRHPNFIWSQLADDRLTASFIADGHHLPAATLKAMLRAKTLDRAILVSDAAALGGQKPGRYRTPIGGEVDVSTDGRLSVAGTPYLAGAGHLLDRNIAFAIDAAGLSLPDALRLASANPGAFAGDRGKLVLGARADITRFHWSPGDFKLGMVDVFLAGQKVLP
ncbi:amidohydrolase family protein [Devosia sp. 63-57]|uniref:N-acetylglucosamine-6-phosphate deacetylase n=1 Tax=Devosia sp. 63-57 TaxID=1895751 RepID=UPI00086EC3E6|nr:amidohydrolase family protein [Devosia sp. 63-57]ODT47028.1 MAG: N-acetylglucosamine-6-phosphate deacetylase [Pelagibacterium sp. SCN 63-126]ODU88842.1 MAG: N-acetylglucosamine-6-phosphate deacetylase [Pelagibacterium sp. SCN 63-17]OJX43262.1 MAG: N-acetylglucosamine-6-phosphate deacetylase [Devosia sp. 63-57]